MANVVAMCGSLRKGSFNRQLMNASIGLAPVGMTIKEAPSFAKFPGFVRDPSGSVLFDDISISIRPWPGGGLVSTRGHIVDHWALSVADLGPTVARLKSEGVKFLEEIHSWGTTRAAMIEGPDRVAIELVEVR